MDRDGIVELTEEIKKLREEIAQLRLAGLLRYVPIYPQPYYPVYPTFPVYPTWPTPQITWDNDDTSTNVIVSC